MVNRVQTARSSVTHNRPAAGSRQVGELYINFADYQIGMINASQVAQDLVAVRYFSATANYNAGDWVVTPDGHIAYALAAITAGAYNSSQWSQLAVGSNYLPLSGGTLTGALNGTTAAFSGTGSVTQAFNVLSTTTGATLNIQGNAGTYRTLTFQSGNQSRWSLFAGNVAEGSGNVGSDLQLNAYDNTGTFIFAPLTIARATGAATFSNVLQANGGNISSLSSSGYASFSAFCAAGANAAQFLGYKGGSASANLRWNMQMPGAVAESGTATGSDFALSCYDNTGAFLATPMTLARATQQMTLTQPLIVPQIQMGGNRFNWNWTGAVLQVGINATTFNDVVSHNVGAPYTYTTYQIDFGTNSTGAMWDNSSNANCTWTVTVSDPRVKRNVVDAAKDAIAAIKRLKVFEFDLEPPGFDKLHFNWGLMADEELEETIPSAYVAPTHTEAGETYAIIRELPIVAALVKAVQQLTERVEMLEAKLAAS